MADLRFRILLIASAVVLVCAVINVVWLIRTRHAARPGTEGPRGARAPGSQAADPGPSAGPSATPRRPWSAGTCRSAWSARSGGTLPAWMASHSGRPWLRGPPGCRKVLGVPRLSLAPYSTEVQPPRPSCPVRARV